MKMAKPSKKNVVQLLVSNDGLIVITPGGTEHNVDELTEDAYAQSFDQIDAAKAILVNKLVKDCADAGALFVYEEEIEQFESEVKWGKKMVTPITEWKEWLVRTV